MGNIPVELPVLKMMRKALVNIYMGLSETEMKQLQEEIQVVTETNCDFMVYDIAQILKGYVDTAVNGIGGK